MPFILLMRCATGSSRDWKQKLVYCDNVETLDNAMENLYNMLADRRILVQWANVCSVAPKHDATKLREMRIKECTRTSMIVLNDENSLDYERIHVYVYDIEQLDRDKNGAESDSPV